MTKQVEENAIESFRSGLNCAQAIVKAYSENLNYDNNLAQMMACGFGGGMGRLQETCGAVTGSFMVLGIYNSSKIEGIQERKEATYAMIQKFNRKFKELNKSTDCLALLQVDLKTKQGHDYALKNNLFGTVCEKCIKDAVNIVNHLIE